MVLDEGSVVEFDSPNGLLCNDKSLFFKMTKSAGLVKNK